MQLIPVRSLTAQRQSNRASLRRSTRDRFLTMRLMSRIGVQSCNFSGLIWVVPSALLTDLISGAIRLKSCRWLCIQIPTKAARPRLYVIFADGADHRCVS